MRADVQGGQPDPMNITTFAATFEEFSYFFWLKNEIWFPCEKIVVCRILHFGGGTFSVRWYAGTQSPNARVDADRVYCFFGKSGAFAFDHSGKPLWRKYVGTQLNGWGSAASPVPHGNLVFVNASVESQTLFALDKKTRKEKWSAKGIKESWNTPIVVKNKAGNEELVLAI